MKTIIEKMEAEREQHATKDDAGKGYYNGIGKAIDLLRAEMPLTVMEVVEYVKQHETGCVVNSNHIILVNGYTVHNLEQLTKIIRSGE